MAGIGPWEWDLLDGTVERSDALRGLVGVPSNAPLDHAAFRDLLHAEDVARVEEVLAVSLRTAEPFGWTARMHRFDRADVRTVECYGEVFTDAAGAPMRVLGTVRDVTEQHRAREELAYLAEHDPLTGVANRRRSTGHRPNASTPARHCCSSSTALQRQPRATGSCAPRLGADATLGRLDGDEFAVVVPACDPRSAMDPAERLCAAVRGTPMPGEDATLRVAVSIGVAARRRTRRSRPASAGPTWRCTRARGRPRPCAVVRDRPVRPGGAPTTTR